MKRQKLKKKIKKVAKETAKEMRPTKEEKSSGRKGIGDLKEVVAFAITLVKTGIEITKDGFNFTDLFDVLGSEDVRDSFGAAVDNISDVGAEVSDITVSEGFTLAEFAWDRIEKAFL